MDLKQILVILVCLVALSLTGLIVFLKNKNSKANTYLGFYVFFVFITFFLKIFDESSSAYLLSLSYTFIIPGMLCLIPFLYLYTKKITNVDFNFDKIQFLHFLPALIVLSVNLFTYLQIPLIDRVLLASGQVVNPEIMPLIKVYARTYIFAQYFYDIQALFYLVLMLRTLYRHKVRISNEFSYTENISLNWLQTFIFVYIFVVVTEILLYSFVGYMIKYGKENANEIVEPLVFGYDIFSTGLTMLYTLFIGFYGLKQADIFVKTEIAAKSIEDSALENIDNVIDDIQAEVEDKTDKRVYKFELSEIQKEKILSSLLLIMDEKKLYLNRNLSLIDVADEINTNKNYLSMVINEKLNMNFFHFVNQYRLNEAVKLMDDPRYENYSIEGIAQSAGFNSKSVFNPTFKKLTGKTPSEYRKEKMN